MFRPLASTLPGSVLLRGRRTVLLAGAAAVLAPVAAPAQVFPDRPVTLVVPYPVGGPVDIVGRAVAEALARQLGQPVVVENRGGAGGTIGSQRVARAPADGHVLLMTAQTPITIAHHFEPKPPYDAARDLLPIARITSTPVLVLGSGQDATQTLASLFDRARHERRALNFGAPGLGNEMHLIWEMIRMKANAGSVAVPYQGTGPGLVDLAAGRLDAMVTAPASVRSLLADGKVRALAVVSDSRLAALPEVPTITEAGIDLPSIPVPWLGLFAPAGTPPAVAGKLFEAVRAAADDAAYRERMSKLGMDPRVLGLADFATEVARYRQDWDQVIGKAGIRFDGN